MEEKHSVLAMYDIRGIQNYIFKSNKLKEIIGASVIVDNIITDALEYAVGQSGLTKDKCIMEWKAEDNSGTEFISDDTVQIQVLFVGGGNAYVLFRERESCNKINQIMAKYVLENTYSLNLAVAVIDKSDNYLNDYRNIQNEMRRIKAIMPETKPVGTQPVFKSDSITGYPLTCDEEAACNSSEALCTEARLKRKNCSDAGELDDMVTSKGDNSTLALVHIDGNNMGKRLMEIMQSVEQEQYGNAVATIRAISKNIDDGFKEAYSACEQYVEKNSDKIKPLHKGKLIRKIICAGDDITFICNAKVAIGAVETFIKETYKHVLYDSDGISNNDNISRYGLSACAGIAYFNSHFPIRDAYGIAESCCKSAKDRAKKMRTQDGFVGSYLDYQICMNVNAGDLKLYRKNQYALYDKGGYLIIDRPYYIPSGGLHKSLDELNEIYDIAILKDNIKFFSNTSNDGNRTLARSQTKKLRNSFANGSDEVERYLEFLASRGKKMPRTDSKTWYDALEIVDFTYMED